MSRNLMDVVAVVHYHTFLRSKEHQCLQVFFTV